MSVVQCNDDLDAFALLHDRLGTPAFSLARRICGSAGAEDVTQEAFLSVWRNRGSYDARRGGVLNWVLATVRYRAIDWLRRERQRERRTAGALDVEWLEATERTEEEALRGADVEQLRSALATLPSDQRQAILLAFFRGLSQAEVAQALELPLGTVKGRIRLGLKKLRYALSINGAQDATD